MANLTLNNGQVAKYKYTDSFDRPVYKLESGTLVCCVNLNGTYLHTMTSEYGEPDSDSPLIDEYQPVKD